MVDFGGWDMPLHYGSQIDEHHAVRQRAGIFDVSHMTVIDVTGQDATRFLSRVLANDVGKLSVAGKGLYSCMLNESGGVIDDLIAYRFTDEDYRLVVNAATGAGDLAWLEQVAAADDVTVTARPEFIMLAIQGPAAVELAAPFLPPAIRAAAVDLSAFESVRDAAIFVARTGYTGEDGWEIVAPVDAGLALWDAACAAGVVPCGLGARDTLRLEAGLGLYGQDMDANTSPLRSGVAWTVAWEPADREFIGRAALEAERAAGVPDKLVGLVLEDRGIMRHGQRVKTNAGDGVVTSGGYSPTMQRSIALARIPDGAGGTCHVEIRKADRRAVVVRPPFVRHGKILVDASG